MGHEADFSLNEYFFMISAWANGDEMNNEIVMMSTNDAPIITTSNVNVHEEDVLPQTRSSFDMMK